MEYLTISTICENTVNPIHEIAKLVSKHGCRIVLSRFYSLGMDYAAIVHVGGNWNGIAKVEASLPTLSQNLKLELLCKRTQHEKSYEQRLPYNIEIFALDQPGVIFEISEFFASQSVEISKWKTTSYHTINHTPVFTMKISINIPGDSNIADLREQFLIFCDDLNLDGTFEPNQNPCG